ncbi:hypothetical protein HYC85_017888 [Camellia sinensis]|uniref:Alpha-1,4 glucan phosphorylase n=1 Tax=Camellia sinensis TaxID=4442 RepID=A0A7J7GV32_CAMSI|nr:hypothetical protein HYC85_017888 [Camellia sinensis]
MRGAYRRNRYITSHFETLGVTVSNGLLRPLRYHYGRYFLFGAKVNEVPTLRDKGAALKPPLQFARVVRMVQDGYFGFKDYFKSLCDTVEDGSDFYLLGHDFSSYLEAQTMRRRPGESNHANALSDQYNSVDSPMATGSRPSD